MLTLLAVATACMAQPDFGQAQRLDSGWLFNLHDDTTALNTTYDDSRWQRVSVPHDWGVTLPMSPERGSCQGFRSGGIGWYRHHFRPTADDLRDGRRMFIYFEGIYNRATVYVNGRQLGYRPSGFASVIYDLTPHLQAGEDNVVAVRVDHSRQNDARWYTGSGINRPVWIVRAAATHFELWGTAWKLKSIADKRAVVEVTTQVNLAPADKGACSVFIDILNADGKVVATAKASQIATSALTLSTFTSRITIPSPRRWTLDNPYLYKVRARVMTGTTEVDRSEVPLGLRTLRFDANKGFALNDQWMKVKGVCIHDDAGVLGTAVPTDVWRRRLLTLKELGVNALRMSHNPHATDVYALADSIGLLVMDEASDEWEFPKRKWLSGWNNGTPGFEGTYDYFEEWIDRDVADMVRRDRCHPSIFMWSIGNEVDYPNDPYSHPILDGGEGGFTQPMYGGYKPEQPNAERIGRIAQRLAAVVREHDTTRPVTGALAGVVMSNQTLYPEAVDVVGYNYTESRYDEDHRLYPKRVIYGSENRHDLPAWQAVKNNDHIFGQFLWTGIDYLGESGPWPARGSEAGLLDLAGFVKPLGHYRAALWAEHTVCYIGTSPLLAGQMRRGRNARPQRPSPYAPPVWNYNDGQRVRVMCYTNAQTAELSLCPAGKDTTDENNYRVINQAPTRDEATGILYWDIDFEAGRLLCRATGTTDQATASIVTTGRPFALRAQLYKPIDNSYQDVAQIVVEVVDEQGNVVPLADNNISCFVRGNARLLGMENGNIRDTNVSPNANNCRVHNGRLIAYIQKQHLSHRNPSTPNINIRFTSPLLKSAEIQLR